MGAFLVILQLGLLLLLAAMAAGTVLAGTAPLTAWLLAAASAMLGLWTLAHNRIGNFNIRPTPKAGGKLITSGPYQYIRHPMYSAVLLGGAALAWASAPWAWLAWAVLCVVLWHKSSLEERWMADHHPHYAAYRQHSRRFIPGLL